MGVVGYFKDIKDGIQSTINGLGLTFRHFKTAGRRRENLFVDNPDYYKQQAGIVTLQYPHEQFRVPEIGRYQLDCEIDDCIVCDKCAKVCPVDCIEIEAVKSPSVISYASDGSPIRLHAAKFNIDMAKCCFCGLCTTVCPTECLIMTDEYDFAVLDLKAFDYAFSKLSETEIVEKKIIYQQFLEEKEALKSAPAVANVGTEIPKPKPVFKPSFKKPAVIEETIEKVEELEIPKPKPVFKPSFKKSSL